MLRRSIASGLLVLTCALSGCAEKTLETPAPQSRPVKLFTVEGGGGQAVRSFPGQVNAAQRADLSFRVPGRLREILVREGDLVIPGQEIAKLDPTDYLITLEERQARFDNAEQNYNRARELVKSGNISRLDFDRMEADYRSAQAALNLAEQELDYTVLTSPFRGRIAERLVDNFEEVQAKQTVFLLQNVDQLDVVIDLPESLVRSFSIDQPKDSTLQELNTRSRLQAVASFEGRGERSFALEPKELATNADRQTQTFRATFSMEQPADFAVLPGMTATVEIDFSSLMAESATRWVPAGAVQADTRLEPQVWILDPDSMTVSARTVEVGEIAGDFIAVTAGLEGGEEVVTVGTAYLSDGMAVTRMESGEQAVPRDNERGR